MESKASWEPIINNGRLKKTTFLRNFFFPKEFISLTNKTLPFSAIEPKKYLASRGISKEDILKYKIGYCPSGDYAQRIIVPSFNLDGNLSYFVARSYDKFKQPYKNPNISKDLIFNELYLSAAYPLVIVEGVFDTIACGNTIYSIPLLGNSINEDSKIFKYILKHNSEIYVILDRDAKDKQISLIKKLLDYDVHPFVYFMKKYKDLGETPKSEIDNIIKNSILINNKDDLLRKILL